MNEKELFALAHLIRELRLRIPEKKSVLIPESQIEPLYTGLLKITDKW